MHIEINSILFGLGMFTLGWLARMVWEKGREMVLSLKADFNEADRTGQ